MYLCSMGIYMAKRYCLPLLLLWLLVQALPSHAQKGVTTAGFQIKPIFPSDFLNTDSKSTITDGINYSISNSSGYSAGMVIRHGITERLSFESGISYTKRNYKLSIDDDAFSVNDNFSIISYEIPIMGMVFIQLSEYIWMTTAIGGSIDLFPSDIFTSEREVYNHYSLRRGTIVPAFASNLGYEYRTEKSGYFYIGATYHRPFNGIYNSRIQYLGVSPVNDEILPLTGSYLTIDFRYFFHQDPEKVKKKEMSVKKRKRLYRKIDKKKEREKND